MTTTNTACGTPHIGQCTTTTLYTPEQAEDQLVKMGFVHNDDRAEWVKDSDFGRLAWTPNYCDQTNLKVGTRFFLRRPNQTAHLGTIEVLGGTK